MRDGGCVVESFLHEFGRERNVQYGSDGCSDGRQRNAGLPRLLRLGWLRLGVGLLRLLRRLGLRLVGLLRWLLWLVRGLHGLLGRLLWLVGWLRQLGRLRLAYLSRNSLSRRRSAGNSSAGRRTLRRASSASSRREEGQGQRHDAPDEQSQTRCGVAGQRQVVHRR